MSCGETNTLFQTREWLLPWRRALDEGKLLLIVAECDDQVVALAPLFASEGMVFFLGAGESDYLDFIGDTSHPEVLPAILEAARAATPGFLGFRFHLVPSASRTGDRLRLAAAQLGLACFIEKELPAYEIDMIQHADFLRTTTSRSMLKRETYFRNNGRFEIQRLRDPEDVRTHLPAFFEQHAARWAGKDYQSPFLVPRRREWLEYAVESTGRAGWLRLRRLDWNDRPLAISFSWSYRGVHYAGPWSFDIEHGRHCPGHVILRHAILDALDEGLLVYDLRGGDDQYKSRFPTRTKSTTTWGLYPPGD
ncbi:GNAT family N-acetyltransferase [Humisphaera borealis]|uniref:GNAT family N-acetyltransferase n=1 Tax=Humisphaera borealis TaxID=2807512 RepID=A0A7M2WY79_9BACT|nr:GNAT family N-acetyltransferase [Humisphaera borealis]QOV90182.1 GNAT family N-acetyltransferase [Humisphaera borealis]